MSASSHFSVHGENFFSEWQRSLILGQLRLKICTRSVRKWGDAVISASLLGRVPRTKFCRSKLFISETRQRKSEFQSISQLYLGPWIPEQLVPQKSHSFAQTSWLNSWHVAFRMCSSHKIYLLLRACRTILFNLGSFVTGFNLQKKVFAVLCAVVVMAKHVLAVPYGRVVMEEKLYTLFCVPVLSWIHSVDC